MDIKSILINIFTNLQTYVLIGGAIYFVGLGLGHLIFMKFARNHKEEFEYAFKAGVVAVIIGLVAKPFVLTIAKILGISTGGF